MLEESGALATALSSPPPRHEQLLSNLGFGGGRYRVTGEDNERALVDKQLVHEVFKLAASQNLLQHSDFQCVQSFFTILKYSFEPDVHCVPDL